VSKAGPMVEALGAVDELGAALGTARALVSSRKTKQLIESIQYDLLKIGAEIAWAGQGNVAAAVSLVEEDVRRLESLITELETARPPQRHFYLSGANARAAALDVARTAARRAERRLVTLRRRKKTACLMPMKYLNRLSDLLFLLARVQEESRP